LDLDALERPPDRSGLDAAMRIDDGEAARLGHAPAFDDLGPAGDFADFPERRDGNGRTANDEMLDGCDRPVGLDGARASKYGRHAGADGDPVAIYETPVIGDDLRVAVAARRGNENSRGVEQRHQPDLKRAAGMK